VGTDAPDNEFVTQGKFQVNIDRSIGLITIVPERDVSVDDINEFREGFLYESGSKLILWDLRDGDLSGVTGDEALLFANIDQARIRQRSRLAFVVPKPVDYGIARMISTRMELAGSTATIGQFFDLELARDWLKETG
jgi:hypothetical protein